MPKHLIRAKNPSNQFILDHFLDLKNRCLRSGQDKVAYIYQKIIGSLQKYPLPILCEEQILMLQGVGEKTSVLIVKLVKNQYHAFENTIEKFNEALISDNLRAIDEKDEFCLESCPAILGQESGLCEEKPTFKSIKKRCEDLKDSFKEDLKRATKESAPEGRSKKHYNPGKDSKSGHILAGLHRFQEQQNKIFASKKEIREFCREYERFETVLENEVKYALTEEGLRIGEKYARELQLETKVRLDQVERVEIVLLIDNRERFHSTNRQTIFEKLTSIYKINCRLQQLPVGDFLWMAKVGDVEYVCNCIVERKTVSDLASSILDKRYTQQKYRLKSCGLKNLFYLIENNQSTSLAVARTTVERAIRNTQIRDKFFVHQTESLEDSLRWLALLTGHMRKEENAVRLSEFLHRNSSKSETLYNLWGSMLRGINGVGLESAKQIAGIWRTPAQFYAEMNEDERASLQSLIERQATKQRQLPSNVLVSIERLFQLDCYPE